jgi:plastocyanin
MGKHLNFICVALLTLYVTTVLGQSSDTSTNEVMTVTGEVSLVQSKTGAAVKDASRVVEWLVPRGTNAPTGSGSEKQKYQMVQHNKMFEPNLLVVPIGSLVAFPNLDPWFHNVFSLYRGKKFDLGLYEAGSAKEVRFDRPGASYVFCNIHPEMTAVVLTVDSEFSGISDKAGHLSITSVPPGQYLLHVWYENATPQALQAEGRVVTISKSSHNLPAISIPVTKQNVMKHKNKYDRDYDPDAATPVY